MAELPNHGVFQRIGHTEHEKAYARVNNLLLGLQPQTTKRFSHLASGVATGGNSNARRRSRIDSDPVEFICDAVCTGSFEANFEHLLLGFEVVWRKHACAGNRSPRTTVDQPFRHDGAHPARVEVDGGSAVGNRCDDLQPGPQAAHARHRNAVAAQVKRVLHVDWAQHRNVQVDQSCIGAARQRRGLRCWVIAHNSQHAPAVVCAGMVGVTDCVARPVEPWRLAKPQSDDAVVGTLAECLRKLRAHDRRRC